MFKIVVNILNKFFPTVGNETFKKTPVKYVTASWYINADKFYRWFLKCFIPNCVFPIVTENDGSHVSIKDTVENDVN